MTGLVNGTFVSKHRWRIHTRPKHVLGLVLVFFHNKNHELLFCMWDLSPGRPDLGQWGEVLCNVGFSGRAKLVHTKYTQ